MELEGQLAVHCASPTLSPVGEQWLTECCRVELDGEGNVVTPIPRLLAAAVTRLVESAAIDDAAARNPPRYPPTRLHGCRPPNISVEDYAARLLRYCKNSPVCYIAAFAYMLRLQLRRGDVAGCPLRVDGLTAHRLMAIGSVVATKFFDDKYFSNHHYAQVAGVSLPEWNAMELDFLARINYRARVSLHELFATLREMQALARDYASLPPLPLGAAVAASCAVPCSPTAVLQEGSEASLSSADTIDAVLLTALSSPVGCCLGEEEEEEEAEEAAAAACAASAEPASVVALLPWGPRPAGRQAAAQCSEVQHGNRCSAEAAQQQQLQAAHRERQRLADEVSCQA